MNDGQRLIVLVRMPADGSRLAAIRSTCERVGSVLLGARKVGPGFDLEAVLSLLNDVADDDGSPHQSRALSMLAGCGPSPSSKPVLARTLKRRGGHKPAWA